MTGFVEPDCIWRSDRSWQQKGEELRLERGEYQGKSTYKLRLYWRTDDGSWRWSQARATQSGKTWAEFGIKARELESLGTALLAEARVGLEPLDVSQPASAMAGGNSIPREGSESAGGGEPVWGDDIPRAQRESRNFQLHAPAKATVPRASDGLGSDEGIPF